ncbi:MAG TPA: single-stranded DNA-binding protein [Pseudonocardiaceae bacterium]
MNPTTVALVGKVITEPHHRQIADGTEVASFRMVSTDRRFDPEQGRWTDRGRFYVTVTCWRRLAAGVAASLTKGDPVVVTGRLYTREYELDGVRRSTAELEAYAVGPDLARCTVEVRRPTVSVGAEREGPSDRGDRELARAPAVTARAGDTAELVTTPSG